MHVREQSNYYTLINQQELYSFVVLLLLKMKKIQTTFWFLWWGKTYYNVLHYTIYVTIYFKYLLVLQVMPSHPGWHLLVHLPVSRLHVLGILQFTLQFSRQLLPYDPTSHSMNSNKTNKTKLLFLSLHRLHWSHI